jgi:predicted O-methyltransferase YrrM
MSSSHIGLSEALAGYVARLGHRESDVQRRLREETAGLAEVGMQITPGQGSLMALLVQVMGARLCVEVGTFTGYSALAVAQALPQGGRLICCDVSREWTDVGRRYWAEAGVEEKIDLRIAPALETLDALLGEGLEGTVDFAFIDADKTSYGGYYERLLKLARPGGLIAVDNVLWGGSVIDPADQSDNTKAIRALNESIAADERVDHVLLPVGDGLTLARKR